MADSELTAPTRDQVTGPSEPAPTPPDSDSVTTAAPDPADDATDLILDAQIIDDGYVRGSNKPSRPRSWTSFLVCGLSGACFLISSAVLTVVAIYVVHGSIDLKTLRSETMLTSVMGSRIGLFIMVVLPQVALVVPAIAAAILSPVATHRRLSLVRGHWPIWTWVAAAMATPLVGMVSAIAGRHVHGRQ